MRLTGSHTNTDIVADDALSPLAIVPHRLNARGNLRFTLRHDVNMHLCINAERRESKVQIFSLAVECEEISSLQYVSWVANPGGCHWFANTI